MCVELNLNQANAINHNKGAMLVLAGPGSGKTTVITYRVKNLIEKYNVLPEDILVITFTKSATEEMKSRFLNLKNYKKIIYELKISFENEEEFLQNILNEISLVKNELLNIDLFDSDTLDSYSFIRCNMNVLKCL